VEGRLLVREERQVRILVADSDPRVRSALQTLLTHEGEPIVVRESTDVGSLAVQVKEFKPDLVLLEWELPGRPAAALLFALHGLDAKPKVLILSTRPEAEQAALVSGADAFVSKGDPPERLLATFRGLLRDLRESPEGPRRS
jgi:DNA-binding response OmpR family regulator